MYDYGRKDKNGKERELHIEKALQVTKLTRHKNAPLTGDTLGVSKYFTVKKLCVKNEILEADNKTFQCLTCVKGQGEIDGQTMQTGDSFFVPANFGEYTLKWNMEIIMTENEFRPEAVILGGGVCAQGDNLIKPLQDFVNKEIFAGSKGPQVKILTATLGNNAGLLGAVALWME